MKKQVLIALILLISCMGTFSQNKRNYYEDSWKKVEKYDDNSLPQSAIKELQTILDKALKERNTPQIMKAYVNLNALNAQIDSQHQLDILSKLEELLTQISNPSDQALLHSVLADLYYTAYSNNKWQINNRTNLGDFVPSDIAEWTANIYINKIAEHLDATIQNKEQLKKENTKEYTDIIELGEDSKTYRPTLFDFVMYRTINTAKLLEDIGNYEPSDLEATVGFSAKELAKPAKEYVNLTLKDNKKHLVFNYYQSYLQDLLERKLTGSVILLELDKYEYIKSTSGSFSQTQQLNALYSYEKEYNADETTVEIIDAIVTNLSANRNLYWYIYEEIEEITNLKELQEQYDWIQKGLTKYPNYKRINILSQQLNLLNNPFLQITGKSWYYGGEDIVLTIKHKNNQLAKGKKSLNLYRIDDKKEIFLKNIPINYNSSKTFFAEEATLEIGELPYGKYYLKHKPVSKENARQDSLLFYVSDIFTYARAFGDKKFEVFVVDRKNGEPIEGLALTFYKKVMDKKSEENKIITTLYTDKMGSVIFDNSKSGQDYYNIPKYSIKDKNGVIITDLNLTYQGYYRGSWRPSQEELDKNTVNLFTDRSIYRPSQTVYFKAIIIDKNSKIVSNKKHTVKLYNPNGEVVSEKVLTTNEYGSIADSFILPSSGLLGYFRIECGDVNTHFRVEEYKRPTFEVKFDEVKETFKFGEKIILRGSAKSFSGISLQNAEVKYTINRNVFTFWRWHSNGGSPFQDGTVITKDDGSFDIEFIPQPGDDKSFFGKNIYTFNINASITDLNGETQTANYSLSVGDVSMMLQVNIPEQIEKSTLTTIKILAQNMNGADIETSGTYKIYSLDKNDSIQTLIHKGEFKTGEQPTLAKELQKLTSGKLRIQVLGKDDSGAEVKNEADFILFSYNDKKPPYETDSWLVKKETTFKNEVPAEIIFGTSRKDIYVLYQLYNNKQTFERTFIKLNDENKTFKLPYKDIYGDEVNISFTSVIDGKLTTQTATLQKEKQQLDTQLNIRASVFRDKLRPGQDETWTLNISNSQDNPALAEVLASMYDSSLDKVNPYLEWYFNRPYVYKDYLHARSYHGGVNIGSNKYNVPLNYKLTKYNTVDFYFDWLRLLEHIYTTDEVVVIGYAPKMKQTRTGSAISNALQGKIAGVTMNDEAQVRVRGVASVTQESAPMLDEIEENKVISEEANMNQIENTPSIRQNFNETAFFYPQLKTNKKGETLISFTVPESNTTWRFRALAHDKEGKIGELEKMVVTRKELMVTPNLPRFVRQGDKTSVSTKISNLSENAISGKVRIEFFNPTDDKIIKLAIDNVNQEFNLAKDASSSASWTFDIPLDIDLLGIRIVAESESFSDGEQHALAVLPNRMLVIETMPVDVLRKGEQVYTMDKLLNNNSKTIDNYKLTFEFASNPIWYAVQALPTLSKPSNEDAFSWFASYYVNTLGSSLMKQHPKVANMIKAWKAKGESKETLVSKLSKNEELKTLLLEETPWVMDAKNETEQMERLSLLFDLNNTKQLTSLALDKLEELQMHEGAWSWYKGLYPNRNLTQYFLVRFATLQKVGMIEYPEKVKSMQIRALQYADEQIKKDFDNLRKNNKDWKSIKSISSTQLEYLYMRTMYRDIPISKESREAERFYTDVVSNNWTKLNLYEKSLLAVLAKELGNTTLAESIVKSIREHAVVKEEMGMYWSNNKNNVFLSMSAVASHVFMMEALQANGATQGEMNLMKRWLVKQKQTQVWENTNATINAISILLQDNDEWLSSENTPSIKVGKEKIKTENKELGTGYIKTSWTASEIKNEMGKVTISSKDNKPAYGSLYWQYYEDLDKITKQDGKLNISKELFREVTTKEGKSLETITENKPLKVGDRVIVRLVVRSDRDMEFVQIKDMRASCFEPLQTKSGIGWQERTPYYQVTRDGSTNFFFDVLPKGTYVFEYAVFVNRTGEYQNGISSIQSAYANEFTAHTKGIKVTVK